MPEIDRAQYRTGDGPCVDAYRTGVPQRIESTLEPGRWKEFRDSAARHGVLRTLSLPLKSGDEIEQAKGIIMATMGIDAETAFEQLKKQSQHENIKLRDIASARSSSDGSRRRRRPRGCAGRLRDLPSDDETAIRVVDGDVDVVSVGHWHRFDR